MGNSFQLIDLIFFAVIAVFLVIRLRNVLGRRDGHEGGHRDPFADRDDKGAPKNAPENDNVVPLRDEDDGLFGPEDEAGDEPRPHPEAGTGDPLTEGLSKIQAADPSFVPSEFLSGARIAFEMILDAFAAGDTATLKPILSSDVFANFQSAIRNREAAGETLEEALVGIKSADILEAWVEAKTAYVTVKFISEQISAVYDENGDVVEGDPNKIIEITDFWTFSRSVRTRDPNWTLVETRSPDDT